MRTHRRNPLYFFLLLRQRLRARAQYSPGKIESATLSICCRTLDLALVPFILTLGIRPRFKWFNKRTAPEANRIRQTLLERLEESTGSKAGGSKLHTGLLSPGCTCCIEGDWACNFINRLCNLDCFFCKRSHSLVTEEPEPETWGFFFSDPQAHLEYLRTFNITGVSFSGGEPLLVQDRLLQHIREVRREFGRDIYIWMYTNGVLLEDGILSRLKDAGLDEIRINIAANGYDLSPAVLAGSYINKVTVEIPCIPEDLETLKTVLPQMERSGIDFLNIHQLSLEEQNCRELVSRSYHFTGHGKGISIYESEICALELLLYACERGISLPINYCSSIYKQRYQERGFRQQRASAFPGPAEELTEAGYIRRIELFSSREQLDKLDSILINRAEDRSLWKHGESPGSMILHSSLLRHAYSPSAEFQISYFRPGVKPAEEGGKLEAGNLRPDNRLVRRVTGLTQEAMKTWAGLYLEPENQGKAGETFYPGHRSSNRKDSSDPLRSVTEFEVIPRGFPEIF